SFCRKLAEARRANREAYQGGLTYRRRALFVLCNMKFSPTETRGHSKHAAQQHLTLGIPLERLAGEAAPPLGDREPRAREQRFELGREELTVRQTDHSRASVTVGRIESLVVDPDVRDLGDRLVGVIARVLELLAGRGVAEAGPGPAPAGISRQPAE